MMPFEKYLQDDFPAYENTSRDTHHMGSTPFSTRVQFQIPQFMYAGPPTLAPGGGAEVLPLGMFNHNDTLSASWFSNNHGLPPDTVYLSSSLRSCVPLEQYRNVTDQQNPTESNVDARHYDLTDSALISKLSPPQPPPQMKSHDKNVYSETRDQPSLTEHSLMAIGEATGLSAPSPLGLPVYSATGFDVLSILARVATRPNPRVVLGPVDLTCSFVIVDVRRHDQPIVYCSPSFCRLSGYSEAEVLGRNCRFLQSPDGHVQKGEQRRFTSPEAVAHLKKNLLADKECQTSIVNYRKDGNAFINLVTVIPITGGVSGLPHEETDVVYHVGFQVDLTEQPNVILPKLRDGSYMVNYSSQTGFSTTNGSLLGGSALGVTSGAKKAQIAQPLISKELKKLLADTDFIRSIPISTLTTVPPLAASSDKGDSVDSNQWLNLMLLESCPDFIHVVSLKGSFLYVAPSVRRVLGYEPEEMVGGSIADFSHPEDIVPLMRELKESSSTGGGSPGVSSLAQDAQQPTQISIPPRTVDLLFRARTKAGAYVWVECRGRLHVEPGKGRKAIILSGRAREMPRLRWDAVLRAGGLARGKEGEAAETREQEFWSMLGGQGTFTVVGPSVKGALGWNAADLIGRCIGSLLSCDDTSGLDEEVKRMRWEDRHHRTTSNERPQEKSDFVRLRSRLRRADGESVDATVVLHRPIRDAFVDASPMPAQCISPSPIICQIKLDNSLRIGSVCGISAPTLPTDSSSPPPSASPPALIPASAFGHQPGSNVFDELETNRGSSWQYELQQLKFANQRLEDEVCFLEAQLVQIQALERTQVVDLGQGQPEDSEQTHQQAAQIQHCAYVSPTPLIQQETVAVCPIEQPIARQIQMQSGSCLSSRSFCLLNQAQTPPQTYHSKAAHPSPVASVQVPAPTAPSTMPIYTMSSTSCNAAESHDETSMVFNQRRRSETHQTPYTHHSPLQYHSQHHQRQQSYPPYAGHHPSSSYPHSRLKRSWDAAQNS